MRPDLMYFMQSGKQLAYGAEKEGAGGGANSEESEEEETEEGEDEEESEDEESEDDEDDEEEASASSKKKKKSGADDDMSEDDARNAKALYKLLADPETRNTTLETLARKAGLLKGAGKGENNDDAKDTILGILSEALGDDYSFLAKKLAPAMEKLIQKAAGASSGAIQQLAQQQSERDVDQALRDLARDTKGLSRKFEARMGQLADDFPKGQNVTMKKYVQGLFSMANSEKGGPTKKKIADSINRNRTDLGERLSSGSGSNRGDRGRENRTPAEGKEPSLREILTGAMEQVVRKGNKR